MATTTMTTELALFGGSADLPAMDPASPEFRQHVETGAVEMARVFREQTARIHEAWGKMSDACRTLDDLFRDPAAEYHYPKFDIELYYDGSQESDRHGRDRKGDSATDRIVKKMNVRAWEILITQLGIKNLMSIKRREEFEKQIQSGDVPEVTPENIINVIMGLVDRAAEFATEAAKECLGLLTPASGHYKTNSGFKVGRRVILSYWVERKWDGKTFRPNYYREKNVVVLDGTFRVLDEKGPLREGKCPLAKAIEDSPDGKGETDYFKFKCFKNGNLHVEFRRPDLVKKLNGLATGEFILGQDTD